MTASNQDSRPLSRSGPYDRAPGAKQAGPMRGGGGRGGQRPGARVSGGPGRKAKTPWGIQDFISGGSRILIRGGGPT